jgi:uncharacterized spore protein YtfJ
MICVNAARVAPCETFVDASHPATGGCMMTDVERLLKSTVEELDKLLNPKNVLGEPIERDGATVIPIVSYGFGFGAGGGEGGQGAKAGTGGGTGAGGGIKPIGAIIIDANGARVEAVKGAMTSVAQAGAQAVAEVAGRAMGAKAAAEAGTGPEGPDG